MMCIDRSKKKTSICTFPGLETPYTWNRAVLSQIIETSNSLSNAGRKKKERKNFLHSNLVYNYVLYFFLFFLKPLLLFFIKDTTAIDITEATNQQYFRKHNNVSGIWPF